MSLRRQRQIAELLHQELSQLLQQETRDPRLGFVTVTGVEVNADYSIAQVFVTVLGDDQELKEALVGLGRATGFFRRRLMQNLSFLRSIPELRFKGDNSLEYGLHIDSLLDQIQEESDQTSPEIESDSRVE